MHPICSKRDEPPSLPNPVGPLSHIWVPPEHWLVTPLTQDASLAMVFLLSGRKLALLGGCVASICVVPFPWLMGFWAPKWGLVQ